MRPHVCQMCQLCQCQVSQIVRTYVCTYVRTSQKGDTRLRKGKFPLPFRSRVSLAKGGGFEAPPPSFFLSSEPRISRGSPFYGGGFGSYPPSPPLLIRVLGLWCYAEGVGVRVLRLWH